MHIVFLHKDIYITVISACMYAIGFYAFQSVFFATLYSYKDSFISVFCAGDIYLSCI